jgi:multidrug transporter EmrE-like cation transporter
MFVLSVGLLSRVLSTGVNLSVLVPLMSAVTPLASIAIGVLLYGEAASLPKVFALFAACALIGVAARLV